MKSFKASVFQGSSLVATAEDIRGLLEPGHEVFVNTVPYLTHGTKFPSKWTTKTVELSSDYTGETNLEAEISFMPKSRSARKLKPISLNKKASNKETKSVEVDEQVVDSLELIPKPPVDANTKAESASRKPNLRKLTEKKASKSHNQEGANVCAQDTEETKKRGAFCHDVAKKIHPNTDLKLVRRQGSVIPANKTAAATPTAPSSSTPRDMDDANDDSTSSVGNSTQRSLDEARKLAHERVLRKLQEDRKAVEQR
ncbi:hypothetical protein EON65_05425 [archaeon]|nr:MAG: hypothetical protein EON65_05425 [archaeon]